MEISMFLSFVMLMVLLFFVKDITNIKHAVSGQELHHIVVITPFLWNEYMAIFAFGFSSDISSWTFLTYSGVDLSTKVKRILFA